MAQFSRAARGALQNMAVFHVGRSLVRLAAGLSLAATLIVGGVGWATNDPDVAIRAIGPGVAFLVTGIQVLLRREHFFMTMFAIIGVISVQLRYAALPLAEPIADVTLIILGVAGSVMVSRVLPYAFGYAALLLVIEFSWHGAGSGEAVIHAMAGLLGFSVGTATLHWLKLSIDANTGRHRHLFEHSPIAMSDEDFTGVAAEFDRLRAGGVSSLESLIEANPSQVDRLARLIVTRSANPAAVALLGAGDASDITGPYRPERYSAGLNEARKEQLLGLWNGETTVVSEVSAATLRGAPVELLIHLAVPEIRGVQDLSQIMVAITDLTDQRDARRALEDMLRSKDEFVASVSHELRTPLTAVVGLAEELRDGKDRFTEAERHSLVEMVASQGLEVSRIVEDLLVAARVDSEHVTVTIEPLDLNHEVTTVIKSLTMEDTVRVEASALLPTAMGDSTRVRQVIRNLLTNAQRYGGTEVRVVLESGDSSVRAEVRDSGRPIPIHQRSTIFDPYFRSGQTHGITASVGLGLTVARELARLMGGDLSYGHNGTESVFTLSLPTA